MCITDFKNRLSGSISSDPTGQSTYDQMIKKYKNGTFSLIKIC